MKTTFNNSEKYITFSFDDEGTLIVTDQNVYRVKGNRLVPLTVCEDRRKGD